MTADIGSCLGQRQCDAGAQASMRPGDEGILAGELEGLKSHVCFYPSIVAGTSRGARP